MTTGSLPSLGAGEVKHVARLREQGLAVLLVEQNVGQSLDIADRAYVLENGSIRFSGQPQALLASDTLRQAYLGM